MNYPSTAAIAVLTSSGPVAKAGVIVELLECDDAPVGWCKDGSRFRGGYVCFRILSEQDYPTERDDYVRDSLAYAGFVGGSQLSRDVEPLTPLAKQMIAVALRSGGWDY